MAQIETLVSDIDRLFVDGHFVDDSTATRFGQSVADKISKQLARPLQGPEEFTLRMSNYGRPDRQLWMDAHVSGPVEQFSGSVLRKFAFGNYLEDLLMFLAREAGHDVSSEQRTIQVDGVEGHIDGTIDGVLVDCKSASTFSFAKFVSGRLGLDDPFGYLWQLAGYRWGTGIARAGFLVFDKTLGHIAWAEVPQAEIDLYAVPGRIAHMREVLKLPEPPEHCYEAVPDGKSGNEKLAVGCSYCRHKEICWPGLRTFLYAGGPRFLTKVSRIPDVPEINNQERVEPSDE